MIDVLLLGIVAGVTWCVAAEGAWAAAVVFLSVLLSGLVSMNWFEPLADRLESIMGADWSNRVDFIALVGMFAAGVYGLRVLAEKLAPSFIAVHGRVYDVLRWGLAAMTGYITMAFLLTALHTAPLPREFMGFTPERKNFLNMASPDRQWLGFVQYVSEKSLSSSEPGRIFDGTRFQLPNHDNEVWPTFIIRYATRREGGAHVGEGGEAAEPPPLSPGGGSRARGGPGGL